jgi:hypothetical protein
MTEPTDRTEDGDVTKPAEHREPAQPVRSEGLTDPMAETSAERPGVASASAASASASATTQPDSLKGFRGVMAGTLVMEAITVALALFAVAQLYGGLNSTVGYVVGLDALALLLTCAFLRHSWTVVVVLVLQLVLVACIVTAVAVGIVGVLFLAVWIYLLWLRREVSRRMAAGQLPSQQPSRQS